MKKLVWTSILSGFAVVLCVLCMFYVMTISDKAAASVKNIQNSFLVIARNYKFKRFHTFSPFLNHHSFNYTIKPRQTQVLC